MSLEALRARALASLKKKDDVELEEGEVVQPIPPPLPPPSTQTSTTAPSAPASQSSSTTTDYLRPTAAIHGDGPRASSRGSARGAYRGRGRGGAAGQNPRARWERKGAEGGAGRGGGDSFSAASRAMQSDAPISSADMLTKKQQKRLLQFTQHFPPTNPSFSSSSSSSTAPPPITIMHDPYVPVPLGADQPYDAAALYAQADSVSGGGSSGDLASNSDRLGYDPQLFASFLMFLQLQQQQQQQQLLQLAHQQAVQPTSESDASKFLSLLAGQIPGMHPTTPQPSSTAPADVASAAEEDMEVEPAQTLGRIILANPISTATTTTTSTTAKAAPRPQKPPAVKAPVAPKPTAPRVPARATTPPLEELKSRLMSLKSATAAQVESTKPIITKSTPQKPPSTKTPASDASLIILLDSASEDESSEAGGVSSVPPRAKPLAAGGTAASVAVKSAAKTAATTTDVELERIRLRLLIAQKELELAKKRPADEEKEKESNTSGAPRKVMKAAAQKSAASVATAAAAASTLPPPSAAQVPAAALEAATWQAGNDITNTAAATRNNTNNLDNKNDDAPLTAASDEDMEIVASPKDPSIASAASTTTTTITPEQYHNTLSDPNAMNYTPEQVAAYYQYYLAQMAAAGYPLESLYPYYVYAASLSQAAATVAAAAPEKTPDPTPASVVPEAPAAAAVAITKEAQPQQITTEATSVPPPQQPQQHPPQEAINEEKFKLEAIDSKLRQLGAVCEDPVFDAPQTTRIAMAVALRKAMYARSEYEESLRHAAKVQEQVMHMSTASSNLSPTEMSRLHELESQLVMAREVLQSRKEILRQRDLSLASLTLELRITNKQRTIRGVGDIPIGAAAIRIYTPFLRYTAPVPSTTLPGAYNLVPLPVDADGTLSQGAPAPPSQAPPASSIVQVNGGEPASNIEETTALTTEAPSQAQPPKKQQQQTSSSTNTNDDDKRMIAHESPLPTPPATAAPRILSAPPPPSIPPPTVSSVELVCEWDEHGALLDASLSPFARFNQWIESHQQAQQQQQRNDRSNLHSAQPALMHASSLPLDYDSPLLALRSYRLQPIFPAKRTSASYSLRLDPRAVMCRFELSGACNDASCTHQHLRDVLLSGEALAADYASYAPLVAPAAAAVTAEKLMADARDMLRNKMPRGDSNELLEAVLMQLHALRQDLRLLLAGRPRFELPSKKKRQQKKQQQRQRRGSDDEERKESDESDSESDERLDAEGYMAIAASRGTKTPSASMRAEDARYWQPTSDYESMLSAAPHDVELWLRFAKERGGDGGLRVLARALERNNSSSELWLAYLRLFLRLRSWQPEAAQLAVDAIRFNPSDLRIVRLAAQLARTVTASVSLLVAGAKNLQEGSGKSTLLLTAAEALISQGSFDAAQRLLEAAAMGSPLPQGAAVAGEDALLAACCTSLTKHERVLLLLYAAHVAQFHRAPVFPSGVATLFIVPWQSSVSPAVVSLFDAAQSRAELSGGSDTASSALWANAVALHRRAGNAERARQVAAQATDAAPMVPVRWLIRAREEEIDNRHDAALSVLAEASMADPSNASLYALHIASLHLTHGSTSAREAAEQLAKTVIPQRQPSEDDRSAFLRLLALDADLAPLPLPATTNPQVWLSYCFYEALQGAETEKIRAIFARAIAQLSATARRLVRKECDTKKKSYYHLIRRTKLFRYLTWIASRTTVERRVVISELERIMTGEKEGLSLAVHFVSVASARMPLLEALTLYEQTAHALGERAAMAVLCASQVLSFISHSKLYSSAQRCLEQNPQQTDVDRVRQLVSSAAAANPFEVTLWFVYASLFFPSLSLLHMQRSTASVRRQHASQIASMHFALQEGIITTSSSRRYGTRAPTLRSNP